MYRDENLVKIAGNILHTGTVLTGVSLFTKYDASYQSTVHSVLYKFSFYEQRLNTVIHIRQALSASVYANLIHQ